MGNIAIKKQSNHAASYKGEHYDLVTETDIEVQNYAEKILEENFPEDGLIGEEGLNIAGASNRYWIIDPIDGTYNYYNKRYGWASTVALVDSSGNPALSVIYMPKENMLFFANSSGAWKTSFAKRSSLDEVVLSNRERLRVKRKSSLKNASVATWINPKRAAACQSFLFRLFSNIPLVYSGTAGAVEMTHIANNQLDGWAQADVENWDYIPGAFLAKQAGAYLLNIITKTWNIK